MIEIDEKDLHYWLEHVKIMQIMERSQIISSFGQSATRINATAFYPIGDKEVACADRLIILLPFKVYQRFLH